MSTILFSDKTNEFFLLDYTPSHSQLVFRSKRTKDRIYNIDILFKPVNHIIVPTRLKGISISILEEPNKIDILAEQGLLIDNDKTIFSLNDNLGREFYVNAMAFGIYHSNLDILESIFGENNTFFGMNKSTTNQKTDLIFWYPNNQSD